MIDTLMLQLTSKKILYQLSKCKLNLKPVECYEWAFGLVLKKDRMNQEEFRLS